MTERDSEADNYYKSSMQNLLYGFVAVTDLSVFTGIGFHFHDQRQQRLGEKRAYENSQVISAEIQKVNNDEYSYLLITR